LVVDRVVVLGWSVAAAAEAAGVTERTVYRWLARFRGEGQAGLVDRRPVARCQPRKTPPDRVAVICALRRLRMTAAEIAECLSMPLSTVSAVLLREGLGKRSGLSDVLCEVGVTDAALWGRERHPCPPRRRSSLRESPRRPPSLRVCPRR
jgi:hypothetical protein